MTHHFAKLRTSGFTLIELVIVVTIIGILATLVFVAYNGIQSAARDSSVLSDLDALDGIQTQYGLKNGVAGKEWYSGDGVDSDLNFNPSSGNIIDVVIDSSDYCIRAYNPQSGQYKTIFSAATKESSQGACSNLAASAAAVADSPAENVWTKVVAGSGFTCGIKGARAYCWGTNYDGQLGNASNTQSNVPVAVATSGVLGGKTVTDINAGSNHVCAIADGEAYCWGDGGFGQLGNGSDANSNVPVAVSTSGVLSGKTVTAIAAGYGHTCAIASSEAYCWGMGALQGNSSGDPNSNIPVAVSTAGVLGGKTLELIEADNSHTCVTSVGLIYCWGYNSQGQLGTGNYSASYVPIATSTSGVLSGKTVTDISLGNGSTCAVASGEAFCWGGNGSTGTLGNGGTANAPSPSAVSTSGVLSGKTVSKITMGTYGCAIADGQAYCWGSGTDGGLGNGANSNSLVPVAVSTAGVLNGKTLEVIATGSFHACAVSSGEIFCWGEGGSGQLGNGSSVDSNIPVAIN
jgi:prepilin-type N-terminal cleavage/methylation domain-containing protein